MAKSVTPPKTMKMIRITLTLLIQNKILSALAKIGITETYPEPHIITMKPHIFGQLVAEIAKLEEQPTLRQLNIETVDLKAQPRRTTIRYERMPYDG